MDINGLTSLLAPLITLFLGFFVLYKSPSSQVNRSFSFYFMTLAIWMFGVFGMVTSASYEQALIWIKVLNIGVILIPSALLHFVFLFCEVKGQDFRVHWSYLTSAMFIGLSFTPLFTIGVARLRFGYVATPGRLFPLFMVFLVGGLLFSHYILFIEHRKTKGLKHRQISYLLFGTAIIALGGLAVAPSLAGCNFLEGFPVWNLTNVIYGILIAYAIIKERLLDIKVIISRGLARILAYGFYTGVYAGISLFYFNFISAQIDYLYLGFTIAYVVLVAESFEATRYSLQTTTDKVLLRGKYDYFEALDNIIKKLVHCVDLSGLLDILNDAFINILEVKTPRLYILADTFKKDHPGYLVYDLKDKKPETGLSGPLTELEDYFLLESGILSKWERNHHSVREYFSALQAELIVPCIFRQKLIGFIALGSKLTEEPFIKQDRQLLSSIGNQVASALERIRAYEDLRAEIASTRSQLEISSRLSSLGTLAAGLTHEIRNPLAVIQSKLELLPNKLDDREYLMNLQEILPRNIDRIVELINRMLSFARPEKKKIEKIKISKLVNEVIDLIDGEATRHNVKIEKQFNEGLLVEGDYNRLSQVFLNIMLNAIQAMPNGGTLKIVTQDNHGWAETSVIDSGVGIEAEHLDQIFDPFYTSRPTGTGLGLSISRTIVEEHGGKIIVSSAIGRGTTFKVSLPPSFPKAL